MLRWGTTFIWITIIAGGFALAGLSGRLILLFMPLGRDAAIWDSVLRTFGNLLLSAAIASSIYRVTRLMRRHGVSKRAGAILLCCLGAALLMAAMNVRASTGVLGLGTYMDSSLRDMRAQLNDKIRSETSSVKRAQLTHLYAQWTYEQDGTLIPYVTPEGSVITYSPSVEARENRELILFWKEYQGLSTKVRLGMSALWVVAIVVPLILALAWDRAA